MIFTPRVRRACWALLSVGFALALSATSLAAQGTGTVSGTVVDNSGQVVPGATVTLINEATRDSRTAVSGEHGGFNF